MEGQLPPAFTLGRREPQPQEMPARRRQRVVLVLRASMEEILIVHKLDVSDVEHHV